MSVARSTATSSGSRPASTGCSASRWMCETTNGRVAARSKATFFAP